MKCEIDNTDPAISHLLSYTIHLLSQFNIVLDSLLFLHSDMLFQFLMGRSEFERKNFNFTHEIVQVRKLGESKYTRELGKSSKANDGGLLFCSQE